MKPVINAGAMFDITTGTVLDIEANVMSPRVGILTFTRGKERNKADATHHFDFAPDYTKAALDAVLSIPVAPQGQFDGAVVLARMKEFIGGSTPDTLIMVDSYSPM